MAIFPPLDTARRAMLADEVALGVVGNNIANVNTPGYTRQVPDLESDPTIIAGGVSVGTGVHVRTVRQVTDPLLTRRRLVAEGDSGQQKAFSDKLSALAGIANDLSDPSLTSALSDFFDSADALARNPAGLPERETVLGRASALASELQRRSAAIGTVQRSVDDQIVEVARAANDDLTKIAELNKSIAATEVAGQPANDLRDKRQAALNDLAGKIGITVIEEPTGSVTVSATGGPVLVTNAKVVSGIGTQVGGTGLDGLQLHQLGLLGPGGGFLSVPVAFSTGELAGLTAARDGSLVTASNNLDTFAVNLRDAVNTVQTDPLAVDLDGGATTASPLFAGTGAGNLTVAITDPRKIGAALSTQPGDNQNALRLADLRTAPQAGLGNLTFGGYVAGELSRIGEEASQAKDVATASGLVTQNIQEQQQSVSGVNLNEELTNLIKYQHAFQASAQLINVGNQILDDLMHMI